SDILLLRGVDAGIVRKDTLSYLDRKDFAKDIRNQFVYVAKMFNEEMHVLAPKTIASMRDLDGKTVVVDLPDSSTFVTAINVFDKVGQLQRPPFHPKWKEMAPRATVSGWTRFKAAQEWLDRNMPLPAGSAVSAASGAAPPAVVAPATALAPQDPLYREFLEWRAGRAKAGASR